jgi:hypothetical protein
MVQNELQHLCHIPRKTLNISELLKEADDKRLYIKMANPDHVANMSQFVPGKDSRLKRFWNVILYPPMPHVIHPPLNYLFGTRIKIRVDKHPPGTFSIHKLL